MRRRVLRPSVVAAVILAALVALAIWTVVDARRLRNRVARNVTVAGYDVSEKSVPQLNAFMDTLEQELRTKPVNVATFDGGFTVSGGSFGLRIDRPALRLALLQARRPTDVADRLGEYFLSFVRPREVPVPVVTSADDTAQMLSENEGSKRRNPIDPQLRVRDGEFTVLPGGDGEGIDAEVLAAQLPDVVAAQGEKPWVLRANRVPLPSRYTNAELARLVEQATARTQNPIRFVAAGADHDISPSRIRSWVTPRIRDRRLELRLDPKKTIEGITAILDGNETKARDAEFSIDDDGTLTITPSQDGVRCCAPDTVARLERVLASGSSDPVAIDLEVEKPTRTTEMLEALKIAQPVASFTTKHKAGESRVKNIHRIADLLRGTVIEPGETFSVNKAIGPRTADNGFVEANVIEYGVFTESFGGGISQFATTLFNSAFFAGLDIREYKPHSIYIQRYPFGREATLSYPRPDLKIRNNTPYGVLIWPTYTASSITVTLYSTPYLRSDVGEQKVTNRGECKVVTTERVRIWPDGTTKTDTFRAEYLPKEGVGCDGKPTAGATTTTLVPPRTTPDNDAADVRAPETTEGTRPRAVDAAPTTVEERPLATRIEIRTETPSPEVTNAPAPATTSKPKPVETRPADKPVEAKPPKTEPAATQPPADPGPAVVPVAPPVTGVS